MSPYAILEGLLRPSNINNRVSVVAYGKEVCPEYFGEFPIPTETPWGAVIQHDRLWNGLYWLKTVEAGWVLADVFSDETREAAELMEYDRRHGIEKTCGYFFYPYEASCLPLFDMLPFEEDTWGMKIDGDALTNAVLRRNPDYGAFDGRNSPDMPLEDRIQPVPGAGTVFYRFPT